jgi:hypothetical protein
MWGGKKLPTSIVRRGLSRAVNGTVVGVAARRAIRPERVVGGVNDGLQRGSPDYYCWTCAMVRNGRSKILLMSSGKKRGLFIDRDVAVEISLIKPKPRSCRRCQ